MSSVEKSDMELLYTNYLKRNDLTINIGSRKYYRIVRKEYLSVRNGIVLVTIPWKLFDNGKICKVVDENENTFELGEPIFYSFHIPIPDWYMETVTVSVKYIKDLDSIGEYFSIYKDDNK